MSKVFIYTIPRESAYGIHTWTDENSNRPLNKTKVGKSKTKLTALYSPKVGGLLNGLSYKPWIENGKTVTDERGKELTLQQKEEQRWNLPKDYLTHRSWRRGESLDPEKMTYFQNKTWSLKDGATVLDLTDFDDLMFYHVALDSKFIANSEREWKSYKWPFATHYIAIANEGEEIVHARNKRKIQAMAALADALLTSTKKKEMCWILEIASSSIALTDEQAENYLFTHIQADDMRKPTVDKFMELFELLKHEKGRQEFAARVLLKKAIDTRVVYEKSDTYTWNRAKGPVVLGDKYSEAIEFFLNPKKDSLVVELEHEVKSKLL